MNNNQEQRQQQATFWLDYSEHLSTSIRYVEALAAAERAMALTPENAQVWYIRGTCKAMLAHYSEALSDFEEALARNAQYVAAWDGKAWVLGIMGQKQEALAAVNKALELDPDYYEAQKRKRRLEAM